MESEVNRTLIFPNLQVINTSLAEEDYLFDRTDVRAVFITLYSIVFCFCFFGNLLIILVVTLSRRLRSITNFFLANLAVADFCVGVFCVFQNLSTYLIPSWVFGDFLCKMYQFIHSLSYTASIFILVVICMERYFAIIHPITCKQILTSNRLKMVMLAVWVTSALYSAPKFLYIETITVNITHGMTETMCIAQRKKINLKIYDMINFVFLYVIPLLVMTFLYTKIAIGLWQSSRKLEHHLNASSSNIIYNNVEYLNLRTFKRQSTKCTQTGTSMDSRRTSTGVYSNAKVPASNWKTRAPILMSTSSQNVLRARRRVIKMLIVVVLTFAMCNLPFHARKMWQHWSPNYRGDSYFSMLLTPTTFLLTYFNSGINPMLYAFLSRKFRRGMKELLLCSIRSVKKSHTHTNILNRQCSDALPTSQSFAMHRLGSIRDCKNTISTIVNARCDSSTTDGYSM